MKIGLLGGSFNPAHRGHRRISAFALDALDLDEVWWLVSPGNPLKSDAKDMAPLSARLASAKRASTGMRVRATTIESQVGTRYSIDTILALRHRYPKIQFIWLMGGDNIDQFHRWRDWRGMARNIPIAVITRPGYKGLARSNRAMGWLRRFVHRGDQAKNWTRWSLPAIVPLSFRPDKTSATGIRAADPHWFEAFSDRPVRDPVTHRLTETFKE